MKWITFFSGEFMSRLACYFFLIIFVSVITACNISVSNTNPQETPNPSETLAFPTVELTLTNILKATPTPLAVDTSPTPSIAKTLQPETTATSHLCNQASLVEDVSIPNGTVLVINQAFTKVWRLKNTGSCTWTSDYQLVFVSGEPMNSPSEQPLTSGIVRPNETADVSVNLVAPAIAGTYHGTWKIIDPKGINSEPNNGTFDVEITAVLTPQPTAENQKLPDLYVSEFTIWPAKPIKGQPVHVTVGIYNQGNADAAKFTVSWYGLSTFTGPSCSWDIFDAIAPNEGRTLECDYVFQNIYPANKTSLVMIDPGNHIFESNEGNNQGIIAPFGVFSH
jgi:hypothetical protein